MRKFIQLTGLFALPVSVLVIALATGLEAQYIGSSRPPGSAQVMDSIAAAEARAAVHADSVAGDSAQAALLAAKAAAGDSAAAALLAAKIAAGDSAQAALLAAKAAAGDSAAVALLAAKAAAGDSAAAALLAAKAAAGDSSTAALLKAKTYADSAAGDSAQAALAKARAYADSAAYVSGGVDSAAAYGIAGSVAHDSIEAHPIQRPDSVLYLGQYYNEIIGWDGSPEETMTLTKVAGCDSTSEDSLWTAINRIKTTGGDILIKCGDTLWLTKGGGHLDSLPTSGDITKEVRVWGMSRFGRQSIIHGYQSTVNNYSFVFTPNRGAAGGLVFNNITLSGPKSASYNYQSTYEIVQVNDGHFVFNHCNLLGDWFGYYSTTGLDSTARFNYCQLDSVCPQVTQGYMEFNHCTGTLLGWHCSKNDWGNSYLVFNNCFFHNFANSGGRSDGATYINGTTIYNEGNYTLGTSLISLYASASTFRWRSAQNASYLTGNGMLVSNGTFYYGWVQDSNYGGNVTGCYFYGGTNGVIFNKSSGANAAVFGCSFYGITTCITFPASGATYALAYNNTSISVTTLISGTTTNAANNNDPY